MNKRILVVDDDVDVQVQMKVILEENRFETLIADNVPKAQEILDREPIDLMLLDVMMEKDSDGFNFAQELKQDEKFKSIPIIMVTAVNQKTPFTFGTGTDGDFLPVEKFMEKPVDPEKLIQFVQELLIKK